MSEPLETCPWGCCTGGPTTVEKKAYWDADHSLHYCLCHDCGARGPMKHTQEEAITAWNARHEPKKKEEEK